MPGRALIVIAAYALSLGAVPFMGMGAMAFLGNTAIPGAGLVPVVWVLAWVAHAHMSIAWIRDRPVSSAWPRWGTVAGVLSLASPLLAVFEAHPAPVAERLAAALITSGVVAVFLLPSLALAIHLVRFHGRGAS